METSLARLKKGILDENPVFSQALAICPALVVTTSVVNGVGMGIATLAVLLASCLTVSLVKSVVPEQARVICFVVISATFTTIARLLLELHFPTLHTNLGIFIPLIAVNCIILARMGAFAIKNPLRTSLFDALGMGLGFTLALSFIGFLREFAGYGTVLGQSVLTEAYPGFALAVFPAGGFLVLGFLVAGLSAIKNKRQKEV